MDNLESLRDNRETEVGRVAVSGHTDISPAGGVWMIGPRKQAAANHYMGYLFRVGYAG